MAEIIRMPKMSDTMEEGVIASWLKKVGDEIKSGDILAEVETDKATMELESYDDGTLLHIGIKDGESVPVNGIIAIIGEKDEDISEILNEASSDSSNKEEEKQVENSKDNNDTETLKSDYFEQLGITLSTITKDVRMSQNIPEDVSGLLVTKVEQNTDAEIKGIRAGDIIQEINQTSVNDINSFKRIMSSLKGSKKGVLLLINRQGNINFVALKLN